MSIYANSGGDSGIVSYETGSDSITVTFRDGATYLYNYVVTGQNNVDQMKAVGKSRAMPQCVHQHQRKEELRGKAQLAPCWFKPLILLLKTVSVPGRP